MGRIIYYDPIKAKEILAFARDAPGSPFGKAAKGRIAPAFVSLFEIYGPEESIRNVF